MLKRLYWPGWIVIIILATALILTIAKGSQAIINTDHDSNEEKKDIQTEQEEVSKYPGLNLKTNTRETDLYTSSINVPITESKAINDVVHQWISETEEAFLTEVEENRNFFTKDSRAHLNIQLETKKVQKDIYNLVFYVYEFVGGANGINTIKSFTVHLKDQNIFKLDDILIADKKGLETIQKHIKDQLFDNEEISLYLMEDLLEQVLDEIDNQEWAIDKKSLTIYFNEYEIAAGAAGVIEVTIPLEEIKEYLNKTFVSQLSLTFEEDDHEEKKNNEEPDDTPNDKETEGDRPQLDPKGKYVALTFDDGPSSTVTPRVLETLKAHDALATFYMLGSQVDYYPEIAKKVADAGHEIGNHTNNHIDLTVTSRESIHQEIKSSAEKIYKASGQQPKTVRPPYGAFNQLVKDVSQENGQSIILWSVDSLDWQSRNASAVNQVVLRDVIPGSIVLMHDIHESTADALPDLLTSLTEQGYEFITVSELMDVQESEGVGPHYGSLNY